MKKILILIMLLSLISVSAYDFIPYNNMNGTNNYNIYEFINISARDFVCIDGTCYDSLSSTNYSNSSPITLVNDTFGFAYGINQDLYTTSNPTFAGLSLTSNLAMGSNSITGGSSAIFTGLGTFGSLNSVHFNTQTTNITCFDTLCNNFFNATSGCQEYSSGGKICTGS